MELRTRLRLASARQVAELSRQSDLPSRSQAEAGATAGPQSAIAFAPPAAIEPDTTCHTR